MAVKRTLEEQLDRGHETLAELSPDRVIQVQATYHGGFICLTSGGRIFERVIDPTQMGQPGPNRYVWRELPGPGL